MSSSPTSSTTSASAVPTVTPTTSRLQVADARPQPATDISSKPTEPSTQTTQVNTSGKGAHVDVNA